MFKKTNLIARWIVALAGWMVFSAVAMAQQPGGALPAAPAPAAGGQAFGGPGFGLDLGVTFTRFHFLVYEQYSYALHPFYQMTGVREYQSGNGSKGGSGTVGATPTDRDASFFEEAIHAMPALGLEIGTTLDIAAPRSVSIGFDYGHFRQTDSDAVEEAPQSVENYLALYSRFQMDSYFYAIPVRFYLFDASQPGLNLFLGLSVGNLNGNLLWAQPQQDVIIPFSSPQTVGTTRMGVELNGASFGARFEMIRVNAQNVQLAQNPFPDRSLFRQIDFSGSILRISTFFWF